MNFTKGHFIFKNELEKSFPQKFAEHCSQQKFVYQIRATILKAIF